MKLITGSAGFIGFHLAKALLDKKETVIGIDNFSNYFGEDIELKKARTAILKKYENYYFYNLDFSDFDKVCEIINLHQIDLICHFGAQAGIRNSINNPLIYEKINCSGTLSILEVMKRCNIKNILFASSSSVYGDNQILPFSENDKGNPVSNYALTKLYNEQQLYLYYKLYGINCMVLRLFTVYGEYGRPDMAIFKFVKNIIEGKEIEVYKYGNLNRDFTYISDTINGIMAAIEYNNQGYEIINLGSSVFVSVNNVLKYIQEILQKEVIIKYLPMQAGDVEITYADLTKAKKLLNYNPTVKIQDGLKIFIKWYKEYYD